MIPGYTEITYKGLQKILNAVWEEEYDTQKSLRAALKLNVTTQTVRNCFTQLVQVASDQSLTKMGEFLGVDFLIIYYKGKKSFIIKEKEICESKLAG
ncbi:MAG: hypothetical protein KA161_07685 [Saprospiraceae bacterium]|nr:hypothetical protein [Saprospiraceae bacterium]